MNVLNQLASTGQNTASTSPLTSTSNDIADWAQDSFEQLTNFDFANSFSHLLDEASNVSKLNITQVDNNEVVDNLVLTENISRNTNDLSSMQNSLLSTLGLSALTGGDETTVLSQLISASDTSLENLQSSLLTNLQSSLFTAFTQPETSLIESGKAESENINLNETSEPLTEQNSILTTIGEFSFGDNGIDLTDGFDTVNILQHIPIISSIYQNTTGDTIDAAAKLGGGFLYGGTLGLTLSAVDLAVEYVSGTSLSDKVSNFNFSELFFSLESKPLDAAVSKLAPSFR